MKEKGFHESLIKYLFSVYYGPDKNPCHQEAYVLVALTSWWDLLQSSAFWHLSKGIRLIPDSSLIQDKQTVVEFIINELHQVLFWRAAEHISGEINSIRRKREEMWLELKLEIYQLSCFVLGRGYLWSLLRLHVSCWLYLFSSAGQQIIVKLAA